LGTGEYILKTVDYEVIKKLVELLDTCEEGLLHVKSQLVAGLYEQSVEMVIDVFTAIAQLDKTARQIQEHISKGLSGPEFKQVCLAMDSLVLAYELNNRDNQSSVLDNELLPAYKSWKESLNQSLERYVIQ